MKRFWLGSVALIASLASGSAGAADLSQPVYKAPPPPPAPVYNWTGFYIGGNAGWIGSADNTLSNTGTDTGVGGLGTGLAIGEIPVSLSDFGTNGFIGGAQAGYNWQLTPLWVWGVEADIDWADAKKSFSTGPITVPGHVPTTTDFSRDLDWLGTLRGRIGITPTGPFLLYATGGFAYGETKVGNAFICPTCNPPASTEPSTANSNSSSNLSTGWTVGGGLEWAFAPSWSLKAEYLYVDLGSRSSTIAYTYGANNSSLTSTVVDHENIVRAGINYKFNWGAPVVSRY